MSEIYKDPQKYVDETPINIIEDKPNSTARFEYADGTIVYRFRGRRNGRPHRPNNMGPAAQWLDGTEQWKVRDKYHRIGGPAHTYFYDVHNTSGTYVNGRWVQQPTISTRFRVERCYQNNILHSLDQPSIAVYNASNEKVYEEWYCRGVLHRIDGPAIFGFGSWNSYWCNFQGSKSISWFLDGHQVEPITVIRFMAAYGKDVTEYLFSDNQQLRTSVAEILDDHKLMTTDITRYRKTVYG